MRVINKGVTAVFVATVVVVLTASAFATSIKTAVKNSDFGPTAVATDSVMTINGINVVTGFEEPTPTFPNDTLYAYELQSSVTNAQIVLSGVSLLNSSAFGVLVCDSSAGVTTTIPCTKNNDLLDVSAFNVSETSPISGEIVFTIGNANGAADLTVFIEQLTSAAPPTFNVTTAAVPEPSTKTFLGLLFGAGVLGLCVVRGRLRDINLL